MKTVRQGTFETNSSSTHAIVMYSDTEATMMKNGEAWCSNEEKNLDCRRNSYLS